MATKIGPNNTGIQGTNTAWKATDPNGANDVLYDRFEQTMLGLVGGHNEFIDRIAALETTLASLPFPASS